MNEVEKQMATYFQSADWQTRALVRFPLLCAVARKRARDMVERDYFQHVDPDGHWPNYHVRAAGWNLPPTWSDDSNQIESLASGFLSANAALDALAASPSHTAHMTGQGFWMDHYAFGVGYAEDPPERIYVVITAPLEKKNSLNLSTIDNWFRTVGSLKDGVE